MSDYDYDDEDVTLLDNGNEWVRCWQCGGGIYVDHDCGEDTCCCAFPEDNVICDICNGEGGWERTPNRKQSSSSGGSNG